MYTHVLFITFTIFRLEDVKKSMAIFPPRSDFGDVCTAMALIQESHDLKTEDLVNGDIRLENVKL